MIKMTNPKSGFINDQNLILSTDFYQLTMSAAYYQYNLDNHIKEKDDIAVFNYFVRKYPKNRNYLIFAGLEQVIHYLTNARFFEKTIEFLRKKDVFKEINSSFFDEYLPKFKFKLDVWAMKEGNFFFPNEPIMKIKGPMIHAQLAETYILNVINYQTIVASKASRIKNIAQQKTLLEFGTRRSHSPLAGVYSARASYVAGFNGTSNVIADIELGINSSGTMAHSFVQRFDNEMESFDVYTNIYGDNSILLIDTYDTEKAAKKISKYKNTIKAVRIDSGDLVEHSKKVRKILDENGCEKVQIVASSDLNEYKIKKILESNAPIDAFGVGTELATSCDDPTIAGVYKLIEYNNKPKIKTSEAKLTYPGDKQIYRIYNKQGEFIEDFLTLDNEPAPPNSEALLILVVKEGRLITELPNLNNIQQYYNENIKKLPNKFKELEENHIFKVRISKKLSDLTKSLTEKFT
ncbi:MAG: nicotinate phosphoribosyltransferase [Promethearchaeota archaeon]|nr:MAG: nicotinate phosphoribosyltransferase [Candidatus Lokiarchaeota archaeon]